MKRDEALAELQRLFDLPPSRHRVWDSLNADERIAVIRMAGYSHLSTPITAGEMSAEQFERCWRYVERFARLAYRIAAANDLQPQKDADRVLQLADALRGAA